MCFNIAVRAILINDFPSSTRAAAWTTAGLFCINPVPDFLRRDKVDPERFAIALVRPDTVVKCSANAGSSSGVFEDNKTMSTDLVQKEFGHDPVVIVRCVLRTS